MPRDDASTSAFLRRSIPIKCRKAVPVLDGAVQVAPDGEVVYAP